MQDALLAVTGQRQKSVVGRNHPVGGRIKEHNAGRRLLDEPAVLLGALR